MRRGRQEGGPGEDMESAHLSSCSFVLQTAEVLGQEAEEEEDAPRSPHVQDLPWFGSSEPGDLSCPRRHQQDFLIG